VPWALLDANGVQLRSTPIDPQRAAELIVSVLTDFEGPTTEPASLVSPNLKHGTWVASTFQSLHECGPISMSATGSSHG